MGRDLAQFHFGLVTPMAEPRLSECRFCKDMLDYRRRDPDAHILINLLVGVR